MFEFDKGRIKKTAPYLYIAFGLLVIFLSLGNSKIQRVGDGCEYYALYYAWDTTGKPWMTSAAYDAYAELYASNKITSMMPMKWLAESFPALKVGPTSDYNHFWFYSFLAFVCAKILSLIGISLSAHGSFLLLHYLLAFTLTSIAYKYFRWNGVVTVALMTLTSPMIWYIDKAHTELFTYSLVLSSIILIYVKKYIPSALFLALASTQNPSFALITCIPIFYRVVLQWKKTYSFFDVGLSVLTVLLILAHPVYYFTRYGVVTPQLLAGGASPGEHLSNFYIWLIDPDLGLLPNWPLGLAAILFALTLWLTQTKDKFKNIDKTWLTFFILYLAINLYAHSSTINLNSGATPGVSRYALWYLPLAFPMIYKLSLFYSTRPRALYLLIPSILIISVLSIHIYKPKRGEHYGKPTAISAFIQSKLPWLYNPPPEVFLERYSGYGESPYLNKIRGVIGPDCHKLLLLPGSNRHVITAPSACLFDPVKLEEYTESLPLITNIKYTTLEKIRIPKSSTENITSTYYKVGLERKGNFILGEGWSGFEEWGVWSQSKVVTLVLPCNEQQFYSSVKEFTFSFNISTFGKQNLIISTNEGVVWQGDVDGQSNYIHFNIPSSNCNKGLSPIFINISNPTSPFDLGISADTRKLGIGLLEFQISK